MSATQTPPPDYNLHDTPARWLTWVHFNNGAPDGLRKITTKATAPLGVMEAHTALAMLRMQRRGQLTFGVTEIEAESGIGITSSRIKSLHVKGIIAKQQAQPEAVRGTGHAAAYWAMDPAAIPIVEKIERRLQAYINQLAAAAAAKKAAA